MGKISSHAGSAFTELFPSGSADAPSEAATMLVSLTMHSATRCKPANPAISSFVPTEHNRAYDKGHPERRPLFITFETNPIDRSSRKTRAG